MPAPPPRPRSTRGAATSPAATRPHSAPCAGSPRRPGRTAAARRACSYVDQRPPGDGEPAASTNTSNQPRRARPGTSAEHDECRDGEGERRSRAIRSSSTSASRTVAAPAAPGRRGPESRALGERDQRPETEQEVAAEAVDVAERFEQAGPPKQARAVAAEHPREVVGADAEDPDAGRGDEDLGVAPLADRAGPQQQEEGRARGSSGRLRVSARSADSAQPIESRHQTANPTIAADRDRGDAGRDRRPRDHDQASASATIASAIGPQTEMSK